MKNYGNNTIFLYIFLEQILREKNQIFWYLIKNWINFFQKLYCKYHDDDKKGIEDNNDDDDDADDYDYDDDDDDDDYDDDDDDDDQGIPGGDYPIDDVDTDLWYICPAAPCILY